MNSTISLNDPMSPWSRGGSGDDSLSTYVRKNRGVALVLSAFKELETTATGEPFYKNDLHALYHGRLKTGDGKVLIKKFNPQKKTDVVDLFLVELRALAITHHENIVEGIGWWQGHNDDYSVIHKPVSNGTLHSCLHSSHKFLPWNLRYQISRSLASAVRYLHEEKDILHRNITSHNVLLAYEPRERAKLSSFMLASFGNYGAEAKKIALLQIPNQISAGCIRMGVVTKAFDIYSVGMVLLELATGQHPSDIMKKLCNSSQWHKIKESPDRRLEGEFDESQMEKIMVAGLWCALPDTALPNDQSRPSMRKVVDYLYSGDPETMPPFNMPCPSPMTSPPADSVGSELIPVPESFDIGISTDLDTCRPLEDRHRLLLKGFVENLRVKLQSSVQFDEIIKTIRMFTSVLVSFNVPLKEWNSTAQCILRLTKEIEFLVEKHDEEVLQFARKKLVFCKLGIKYDEDMSLQNRALVMSKIEDRLKVRELLLKFEDIEGICRSVEKQIEIIKGKRIQTINPVEL